MDESSNLVTASLSIVESLGVHWSLISDSFSLTWGLKSITTGDWREIIATTGK